MFSLTSFQKSQQWITLLLVITPDFYKYVLPRLDDFFGLSLPTLCSTERNTSVTPLGTGVLDGFPGDNKVISWWNVHASVPLTSSPSAHVYPVPALCWRPFALVYLYHYLYLHKVNILPFNLHLILLHLPGSLLCLFLLAGSKSCLFLTEYMTFREHHQYLYNGASLLSFC